MTRYLVTFKPKNGNVKFASLFEKFSTVAVVVESLSPEMIWIKVEKL